MILYCFFYGKWVGVYKTIWIVFPKTISHIVLVTYCCLWNQCHGMLLSPNGISGVSIMGRFTNYIASILNHNDNWSGKLCHIIFSNSLAQLNFNNWHLFAITWAWLATWSLIVWLIDYLICGFLGYMIGWFLDSIPWSNMDDFQRSIIPGDSLIILLVNYMMTCQFIDYMILGLYDLLSQQFRFLDYVIGWFLDCITVDCVICKSCDL